MAHSFAVQYRVFMDFLKVEVSLIRHRLLAKKSLLNSFIRLMIIFAVVLLLGILVTKFFADPDRLLNFIKEAHSFGPFIIIGLIVLEVIIAPLPGTFIMVAAGALFGVWLGAIYSFIGNVIGSLLAFFLAKRFGRTFVEKIVSTHVLAKYDGFFVKHHKLFLLFYALPIIPVDILSFVCGLSAMRTRKFLGIILLGFIPNTLILAFLGDKLSGLGFVPLLFYTLLFMVVFLLLTWLFKLMVNKVSEKKGI
jgi:uncharacterized membrane protein YdjX (TVP38/TMEM64 family)